MVLKHSVANSCVGVTETHVFFVANLLSQNFSNQARRGRSETKRFGSVCRFALTISSVRETLHPHPGEHARYVLQFIVCAL